MSISTWITQLLQQDSNLLVFVNVLLQQLGLPVPSVPILPLAAVLASLIADWI